jgi:transposase
MMTKRKHFSPAFKLEITKLMVDEKYSIKQACPASGADETSVKRWKEQYLTERAGTARSEKPALTEKHREIQQLKQSIKQLETERKILKKASDFFAKEIS